MSKKEIFTIHDDKLYSRVKLNRFFMKEKSSRIFYDSYVFHTDGHSLESRYEEDFQFIDEKPIEWLKLKTYLKEVHPAKILVDKGEWQEKLEWLKIQ